MLSTLSQPSILAPIPAFGRSLSYRLKPQADPRRALRDLQQAFDPLWGVVGLGEPLVLALGKNMDGLRTFPSMSGPAHTVPSAQHSLWILLRAEDRSAVFDHAAGIDSILQDAFELADAVDTFRYRVNRDLSGYEDGTENPSPEDSIEVALLADAPSGLRGSSFVAVQRWSHDLPFFHSHSREECDNMIGRRREDNEELEDAPESAHVKRSAQESFSPEAFMVRRSMPWTCGTQQGLEFIAYGRSFDPFEQVMSRMLGREDGIVDALFRFSEPVNGAYYWCPPVADGQLDLSALPQLSAKF